MIIRNSFSLPLPVEEAWSVLLDVPRIVTCVPGAVLTAVDGNSYQGAATLRVGPLSLAFAGTVILEEVDGVSHKARLRAKGSDKGGRGTAQSLINFSLTPIDSHATKIAVECDLQLSGAVAQYGRAAGVMEAIAQQVIDEFVHNLEARLSAGSLPQDGPLRSDGTPTNVTAAKSLSLLGVIRIALKALFVRMAPSAKR